MPKRNIQRIDYRIFNSVGENVPIEDNLSNQLGNLRIHDSSLNSSYDSSLNMANKTLSENAIDLMVMSQEVIDILEEKSSVAKLLKKKER